MNFLVFIQGIKQIFFLKFCSNFSNVCKIILLIKIVVVIGNGAIPVIIIK